MALQIFYKVFIILIIKSIVVAKHSENNNLERLSDAPSDAGIGNDSWRKDAIQKLWEERKNMSHTPIIHFPLPSTPNVDLIFKDESASKTGSLKHRFTWALVMWGLVSGYIRENTTLYESSSGNTATSEAYFARLLNLPYITVLSHSTSQTKLDKIKSYGGKYIKTEPGKIFKRAKKEANKNDGFYINQFVNAGKAEEYHESSIFPQESTNVFHEIISQLQDEQGDNSTYPDYFIHSAGTGGTISSVGYYVERYALPTQVVLADTEFSIYFDYVVNGKFKKNGGEKVWVGPGMEGTGFGYAGPANYGATTSLQPSVIHRALKIPDLASTAAMHFLKENKIYGGTSTGVNFVGALSLAAKEKNNTNKVRIVTLLADSDLLYEPNYYNETWVEEKFARHGGIPVFNCWKSVIKYSYENGVDPLEEGPKKCKKEATSTSDNSKEEEVNSQLRK